MKKYICSRNTVLLLCALITLNRLWPAWGPGFDNGKLILWDSYGYYLYLPAVFIHHDPGMENRKWVDELNTKYTPSSTFYQVIPGKDNRLTIKYSMGTAILWLPFFTVAHLLAGPMGYPADGLSPPYSWAILIGGLLYAFIGLWYLRKILLRFFSDRVTILVLILITMGTNYWAQTASDTIMPHSTMFVLNVLIFWWTIRWHDTYSFKHAALLGFTLGLATISRPTEFIWILVPLLWTVKDWSSLREKFRLLLREWKKMLVFALAMSCFVFLQLLYWRYTSGSWVKYSYGERFAITSPFLLESFFSYKKGWFIYTPLMIFCFWGFYYLWKNRRDLFWPLAVFVLVNTWVIMSWECWWYAACFSIRALMEMYPAMAIPLGFLIVHLMEKAKTVQRVSTASLLVFCLGLNLFQEWQYNHGILDGERMTKAYYWRVFGKTSITGEDRLLLEPDHWPADERLLSLDGFTEKDFYFADFDRHSPVDQKEPDTLKPHEGRFSLPMGPNREFSPIYKRAYRSITNKDYLWVRSSVWIRYDDSVKVSGQPPMLVFSYEAKERSLKYKAVPLDTAGLHPGEWRLLTSDYMTPISLYSSDQLASYVWHPSHVQIHIDDLQVEVYEPLNDKR